MDTVVFQSHRDIDRPEWIDTCLKSVRDWANAQGHAYRFYGDELLKRAPPWFIEKSGERRQVIADLGRLLVAREILQEGVDQVIWFDADTLVFAPDSLNLAQPEDPGYAFGHEVWVQPTEASSRLKAYYNVHNAVCVFRRNNAFLDFYIHACLAIMKRVSGGVPPQIIGPKFLTAQYNILGFPLIETVGAFSPSVLHDILEGRGPALELQARKSRSLPLAANLCESLSSDDSVMQAACERLLSQGGTLFTRPA